MEFYLVIECGHEGIQCLVLPTTIPTEARDKVLELRETIYSTREKIKNGLALKLNKDVSEVTEDDIEDDDDITMELKNKGELSLAELQTVFKSPDSYCVQKWNGNKFDCYCKELGIEPSKAWVM